MTHSGIECFLAVCRHKTGSRAADALYITQSSLSTRLKTLERELGGALFHRKKGGREMRLTPAGKEFYELALQYEKLVAQMQQVCRKQPERVRVSTFNSLGTYLLPAVYERFLQEYPQTSLEIQDMELEAASRSVLAGYTDLAFTAGKVSDDELVQIPVLSEPMVLVCSADSAYPETVGLEQLPVREQVYIEWSGRFNKWHQKIYGGAQPQITVSIMEQLRQFLNHPQCWAIVPVSVARGLEKECGVRRLSTDAELPCRDVSIVMATDADNTAAIEAFLGSLRAVLEEDPQIRMLL